MILRRFLGKARVAVTALVALVVLLRFKCLVGRTSRQLIHQLGPQLQVALVDDKPAGHDAVQIGRVVERVAVRLPLRATCVHQALTVRKMLSRRKIPAVIHLGVSRHLEDRQVPSKGQAAHAWVSVGATVVCGGGQLDRYVEVGLFKHDDQTCFHNG